MIGNRTRSGGTKADHIILTPIVGFSTTWTFLDINTIHARLSGDPITSNRRFQFLYTLADQVTANEVFEHYHVDLRSHDVQSWRKLMPVFDAVVELDEEAKLRVRT